MEPWLITDIWDKPEYKQDLKCICENRKKNKTNSNNLPTGVLTGRYDCTRRGLDELNTEIVITVPSLSIPIWLREPRGCKDGKNRAQEGPAANGVFWTRQGCRTWTGTGCAGQGWTCGNRSIDGGGKEGLASFLLAEESRHSRMLGCRDAVFLGSGSC